MTRNWMALGALALLGCAGDEAKVDTVDDTGVAGDADTDADTDTDPTYDANVDAIVMSSCAGIGCHTNGGQSGGLNLDDGYDALLDGSNMASGLDLVSPGSTDDSYLWHKLNGTQSTVGGAGSQMPLGSPLGAEDLSTIEASILDGAPEN